jgi:hypothetical protein
VELVSQGNYDRTLAGSDVILNPGRYVGIQLDYQVELEEDGELALADLGVLRLSLNSEGIHLCRAVEYWLLSNLLGGMPAFDARAGTASIFIPLRYGPQDDSNPDDNVVIFPPNQAKLYIPAVVNAHMASALVQVSAVVDGTGVPRYVTHVHQTNESLTASYPFMPSLPNLRYLMMQRPQGIGTYPNEVMIRSRDRICFSGPWETLEAYTDRSNKIEVETAASVLFTFGGPAFGSWNGGQYSLNELGATPADLQYLTQFGAASVDAVTYERGVLAAVKSLNDRRDTSDSPAPSAVAPIVPGSSNVKPTLGLASQQPSRSKLAPAPTKVDLSALRPQATRI